MGAMFMTLAKYSVGAVGFFASLIAVMGIFSAKMPAFELKTDCTFPVGADKSINAENDKKFADISRKIRAFMAFARQHQAEVVYVRIEIKATSVTGGCNMHDDYISDVMGPTETEAQQARRRFGIGPEVLEDSDIKPDDERVLELWARGAKHHDFIRLPPPRKPGARGLYADARFDAYYSIGGPYVVQYVREEASETASLSELDRSVLFASEVGCAKRRLEYPAFLRPFIPCI